MTLLSHRLWRPRAGENSPAAAALPYLCAWAALTGAAWVAGDRGVYESDGALVAAGVAHLPEAKSGALPLYKYYLQPLSYEILRVVYLATGSIRSIWLFPSACAAAGIVLLFLGLRRAQGKEVSVLAHVAALALVPELFYTGLYLNTTAIALPWLALSIILIEDGASLRAETARKWFAGAALALAAACRFEFCLAGPMLAALLALKPGAARRLMAFSGGGAAGLGLGWLAGLIRPEKLLELSESQVAFLEVTHAAAPGLVHGVVASMFSPPVWAILGAGLLLHVLAKDSGPRWRPVVVIAAALPFLWTLNQASSPKYFVPILALVPRYLGSILISARRVGPFGGKRAEAFLIGLAAVCQFIAFDPAAFRVSFAPRPVLTHDGTRTYGSYLTGYARVALRPSYAHGEPATMLEYRTLARGLARGPKNSVVVYDHRNWAWEFPVCYYLPLFVEEEGFAFRMRTNPARVIELTRGERRVAFFLDGLEAWGKLRERIAAPTDVVILTPQNRLNQEHHDRMWNQLDRLAADGSRALRFRFSGGASEISEQGELLLRGWALNPIPIGRIDARAGERNLGSVRFPLRRPDVAARYPEFGSDLAGFELRAQLGPDAAGIASVQFEFFSKDGGRIRRLVTPVGRKAGLAKAEPQPPPLPRAEP